VQSLKSGAGHRTGSDRPAPKGGIVLPRFLRWPVRHASRLVNQGILFSPRNLFAGGFLIASAAVAAGLAQGDKAAELLSRASAFVGIRIADIEIEGLHSVSRIDVLTSLDLGPQNSLLSFDVHRARADLKRLAWVRDAVVTKTYPDKLVIHITERTPFAVWQNGQALYLVERDGSEIGPFDPRYGNLPLVVGRGANRHAAEIVSQVGKFRELDGEVVSYVRLGDRRWDLHLRDNVVVMLPEPSAATALEKFVTFRRDGDLDRRAIESVDLRLPDRIVVRLSGEAAAARRETVDRQVKGLSEPAGRRT